MRASAKNAAHAASTTSAAAAPTACDAATTTVRPTDRDAAADRRADDDAHTPGEASGEKDALFSAKASPAFFRETFSPKAIKC